MGESLSGKVALVTGSGGGIGRAIALHLAGEGAMVVINSRTAANVERVVEEIKAGGGTALGIPGTVADPDWVEATVRTVRRAFGPITVLVNNAGVSGPLAFAQDVTPNEFLEVLKVNLWGAFLCSKYVLPAMVQRNWGRIVNFTGGGAASDRPLRGGVPYGSSKAGVEGMTRNLAVEVARFGITVNCVAPGRVDTPGFPVATVVSSTGISVGPEHAARLVAWLASDEAAHVNGQTIDAPAWDAQRQASRE